jgi:hypothetical protein
MSLYSVNTTADQLIINSGSKAAVDALQKAYQLGGKVEIKVDSGGGTKRYFGLVRLADGVAEVCQDGDYLFRNDDGDYTAVMRETTFEADYTLVDESS